MPIISITYPDTPTNHWALHAQHARTRANQVMRFAKTFFLTVFLNTLTWAQIPTQPRLVLALPKHPLFGQHFPSCQAALNFLYSPKGNWRQLTALEYRYNYYQRWATPEQPFLKDELLRYARDHQTTAPDANGLILADFDQDKKLDITNANGGGAFMEHNAMGDGGAQRGAPFNHFWFDDNWLARYLSQTYNAPLPWGLYEPQIPIRWTPIGGGNNFVLYPHAHKYADQMVLNGLHYLNQKQLESARALWQQLMDYTQARYIDRLGRFDYPGVKSFYHVGMIKIFAERLLSKGELSSSARQNILQHSRSLHEWLLGAQIYDTATGNALGWKSGMPRQDGSLINTETTTTSVLGIGAETLWSFEPGSSAWGPHASGEKFIAMPGRLRAQVGYSNTGATMSDGLHVRLPTGKYLFRWHLRAPETTPAGDVLSIIVTNREESLADFNISAATPGLGTKEWIQIETPIEITAGDNILDVKVIWLGGTTLELGSLSIIRH